MTTLSIMGGSEYGGGELLRILLDHAQVEVRQITSRLHLGEYVYQVHPNLRKRTQLKFIDPSAVDRWMGSFSPNPTDRRSITSMSMLPLPRSLSIYRQIFA